jgi:hypothetical protein
MDPEKLAKAQQKDVHLVASQSQIHHHSQTCWRGPPGPKECQFNLDQGNYREHSMFDSETESIHLKCLDGLVNNFNETIIQAIQCNMDIKFIGSGPTAKAILYYITDYITKSQLKTHITFAALELAVEKLGEYDPEEDVTTVHAKCMLQKCAHALISHQEFSAQQAASYLMDFEDHFTSHEFRNLYWKGLKTFINREDNNPEIPPPT